MGNLEIRQALLVDSEMISKLHYKSWIRAYKEILPEQYFDQISLEKTNEHWFRILAEQGQESVFLLAFNGDEFVGFINGGPSRDRESQGAELYGLFVKNENKGIGTFLLKNFVSDLRKINYESFHAWVLNESRAFGFFTKMGGVSTKFIQEETGVPHVTFKETMLSWKRI
ncbi:GNAT family N-acetyltransferase [Bacteriovoracales bacterium]|nr:GNAT family N-acetyltransferase [Bacteriovoracales bacterium]